MKAGPVAIDAQRIDALLPQTQCTRCGYSGCLPYAQAITEGQADINQCPPGGTATIDTLARLLGRSPKPLNPVHGAHTPPMIAWIDAARCIGCAKCLPPCPVDAILGAAKYLHTILEDRCTGCELCVAPCPVDCIQMRPPTAEAANDPVANRSRYLAHIARAEHRSQERRSELERKKSALIKLPASP